MKTSAVFGSLLLLCLGPSFGRAAPIEVLSVSSMVSDPRGTSVLPQPGETGSFFFANATSGVQTALPEVRPLFRDRVSVSWMIEFKVDEPGLSVVLDDAIRTRAIAITESNPGSGEAMVMAEGLGSSNLAAHSTVVDARCLSQAGSGICTSPRQNQTDRHHLTIVNPPVGDIITYSGEIQASLSGETNEFSSAFAAASAAMSFDLNALHAAPEPAALTLLAAGLTILAAFRIFVA